MRRNAQLVAQTGCVVLHVDVHPELLGCIEQQAVPTKQAHRVDGGHGDGGLAQ